MLRLVNVALSMYLVFVCSYGFGAVSDLTATITRVEGKARILKQPKGGDKLQGGGFDRYYLKGKEAKVGDRVVPGSVVVTQALSKVRLIYPNGDQAIVGPKSVFKVAIAGKDKTIMELLRGTIRGWIMKGGPRTGMQVQTRTAVMGVRGTEFVISQDPRTDASTLSVIRGEVALGRSATDTRALAIKSGESAEVKIPKTEDEAAKVVEITVKPTSNENLATITSLTSITAAPDTGLSEETKTQIAQLEAQSKSAIIEDIKATDPNLYEQLTSGKSPEELDNSNLDTLLSGYSETLASLPPKAESEVKPQELNYQEVFPPEQYAVQKNEEKVPEEPQKAPLPPPPRDMWEPYAFSSALTAFAGYYFENQIDTMELDERRSQEYLVASRRLQALGMMGGVATYLLRPAAGDMGSTKRNLYNIAWAALTLGYLNPFMESSDSSFTTYAYSAAVASIVPIAISVGQTFSTKRTTTGAYDLGAQIYPGPTPKIGLIAKITW